MRAKERELELPPAAPAVSKSSLRGCVAGRCGASRSRLADTEAALVSPSCHPFASLRLGAPCLCVHLPCPPSPRHFGTFGVTIQLLVGSSSDGSPPTRAPRPAALPIPEALTNHRGPGHRERSLELCRVRPNPSHLPNLRNCRRHPAWKGCGRSSTSLTHRWERCLPEPACAAHEHACAALPGRFMRVGLMPAVCSRPSEFHSHVITCR